MSRRPPAGSDTEPGFLSRWSRRKRGLDESGQAPPETTQDAGPGEPETTAGAAPGAPEPEAEVPEKTDEDMPDLETIDDTTDMSDFFSPGVSDELRNQALRRLFHLAKFNVMDGLDDYCGDFRSYQPLGDLVTADMRHRMEVAQRRLAELREPGAADEAQTGAAGERGETPEPDTVAESDAGRGPTDDEAPGEQEPTDQTEDPETET